MVNILVTAVGSELSFAVINAVRLIDMPYRLIGCDIFDEVVGKYWCDQFYKIPLAENESEYIDQLVKIVRSEKIHIVIPSNDREQFILTNYASEFLSSLNCHILINNPEEVKIFNDKWLSFLWYKENNVPCAESILIKSFNTSDRTTLANDFPMIVKPRTGGGSRSIFKINSKEHLLRVAQLMPDGILQEYLYPDEEEYTAGTYRTIKNDVFSIILKRTLKFGMTNTARVIFDNNLETFVAGVITKSNLKGSNNIQFRLTSEGPKVLEINPRFSGTTGIRAHFGFNEVEMSIQELILNKELIKPRIKSGFVLRHMQEQYHFS